MSGSTTIPLVMTAAGPQPTPVTTIQQTTINNAASLSPGYTADLPASMIEDLVDTSIAAIQQADAARIDAINSVTPFGANAFILAQLGAQFGILQGQQTNVSVTVVFTVTSGGSAASGLIIPKGTIVSDGTYQYLTQASVTSGSGGITQSVAAVASQSGTWAVAAGAVNTVVTSAPAGFTITVTNAQPGVAGLAAQSVQSYRAQVLQAQTIGVQGSGAYITSVLSQIVGVQSRLIGVVQVTGGLKIICGLTVDQNLIAGAIYTAVPDVSTLQGSVTTTRNLTTTVTDGGNTYSVVFVNPPNQVVTGSVTWATNLLNFLGAAQVNSLGAAAFVNYINSIQQGKPINLLEMTAVFQNAVSSVLASQNISSLSFTININGTIVEPQAGTSIIPGDSESFFSAATNAFTVTEG